MASVSGGTKSERKVKTGKEKLPSKKNSTPGTKERRLNLQPAVAKKARRGDGGFHGPV